MASSLSPSLPSAGPSAKPGTSRKLGFNVDAVAIAAALLLAALVRLNVLPRIGW